MTPSPPVASKHYSPKEVATLLGVCERTVLRRIQCGELLASRIGRLLRISDPSFRAFLAERLVI